MGKNLLGRPKIYNVDDIVEKLNKYIDDTEEPMILEFCVNYGINRQYLYELRDKELVKDNKSLADTIKRAIEKEEMFLLKNAERQKINPVFAMFRLKQPAFGYKDKTEIETTGETTVTNKIDLSGMSTEDLKEMLK